MLSGNQNKATQLAITSRIINEYEKKVLKLIDITHKKKHKQKQSVTRSLEMRQ